MFEESHFCCCVFVLKLSGNLGTSPILLPLYVQILLSQTTLHGQKYVDVCVEHSALTASAPLRKPFLYRAGFVHERFPSPASYHPYFKVENVSDTKTLKTVTPSPPLVCAPKFEQNKLFLSLKTPQKYQVLRWKSCLKGRKERMEE